MRSQLRFVMHPNDEGAFVTELLSDPSVVLVDGPRWKTPEPPATRAIHDVGDYCIIWSPRDLAVLDADFIPTCKDWYCRSEFATIQFLRSSLTRSRILLGRLAISTSDEDKGHPRTVERRYKLLRRFIQKTYRNSVIEWRNLNAPSAPATQSRSANPSQPDSSLWIGPHAMAWLNTDPLHVVSQSVSGPVVGRPFGDARLPRS